MTTIAERVRRAIRDVPDFPATGIVFRDITPVLADPALMRDVIDAMAEPVADARITHVVGIESRGFLFGVPIALRLGVAFVPARKPGKLPWTTVSEPYTLEYRTDVLEMHADALTGDARVLVVDDVLATGGTAAAAAELIAKAGGQLTGFAALIELRLLGGRGQLGAVSVDSLLVA